MKKIFILTLVSALLVAMTVAGTVAYLTSTDAKDNAVAGGNASIELVEFKREDVSKKNGDEKLVKFATDDTPDENHVLIPASGSSYSTPYYVSFDEAHVGEKMKINGVNTDSYTVKLWDHDALTNEIDKMVFVKNTGDTDVYVRICFAFEAGNYVRLDRFKAMVHLNKNESDWMEWKWDNNLYDIDGTRYFIAWATYKYSVAPDEYTKISLSQIALDYSALNDHMRAFGDSYNVKAFAQGVQADSAMNADTALKNTFGDKIPFDNVKKVKFTDLGTAIHYLNGENYSANKITSNVTSVTFGLTKDHSAKVEGYNGVLVANKSGEADFTAHAYYVPNGENYDIYILADEWKIYTPAESKNLFLDMTALTMVDTSNLDVSETTGMSYMFTGCSNLKTLDVKDWDVSKVTTMFRMFRGCSALTSLNISNWKVQKVTSMCELFCYCYGLTEIDLSGWDTAVLTDTGYMFYHCKNLVTVFVGDGWNVSKVTNSAYMFVNCSKLVGGENTKFVSNITDKTYARIDGGESAPGYLTKGPAPTTT